MRDSPGGVSRVPTTREAAVFVRSTRINLVLSAAFIFLMGACGGLGGGCGACSSTQPLPGGKLPADQTVEGGAQIRVTEQGFKKLTDMLPGLVNQSLSSGICIGGGAQDVSIAGFSLASARYCQQNSGPGCTNGCKINVAMNPAPAGLGVQVTNQNTLRLNLSTSINTSINLTFHVALLGQVGSCTLGINSNNLNGSFDIAFGIKPADGELDIHLANINSFTTNLNFTGCGILSSFGNLAAALIDAIPNALKGLLTPLIDPLIQNFIPNPLGIKGMMDVGSLLAGISPGTDGFMEARIVPGGYVRLDGAKKALSLGVITGMNADEDPSTRTGERQDGIPLASEPNLCVPPMAPPKFGSPPANLPITTRTTFALNPAGQFDGNPEPAADLAMGMSETMLDLAGHHLVTSGGMCLGVGTTTINQLNVGTISLLVPSLGELTSDTGHDPLLLVTRPQKPLDFTIGDNTASSPALNIGIQNLEVDFYAFLYERYVRAFTLDLTMNVGINLEFEQMPGQPAKIKPSLVGISSQTVEVKVLNSQFVAESAQHLEMVLPSVFDLITPLLGNIPAIDVPSFAGLSLNNLSIQHVTTTQDDFLALYATLGPSMLARTLATSDSVARQSVMMMDEQVGPAPKRSTGVARFIRATTPAPEKIRAHLTNKKGGEMPEVVFDVDTRDAFGRELEWQYSINGGMYHPYTRVPAGGFVVRDPAFAWQGKYTIGLKSRVRGDYRTASDETQTKVIIDSVGPKVLTDKLQWNDDAMTLPMWDIVSGKKISYALGKPGEDAPRSAWFAGGSVELTREELAEYVVNNELVVFAQDEAGNRTIALVNPFHGQPGAAGCACQSSGGPSTGGVALTLLVGLVVFGRRRHRKGAMVLLRQFSRSRAGRLTAQIAVWFGISIAVSLSPGCSCGNPSSKSCETAADCGPDFCARGELPYCIDNTCVCSDDIPAGRVGPYSDVAAGKDGSIWVSAYAQSHGDLVVARVDPGRVLPEQWEWVDGVPDGPVVVPDSKIRGGIEASGADVGMYTSIAVNGNGEPSVTYFDRDTGSLRFAQKIGDVWHKHTIQTGTGMTLGESGELIGMYTSLTLRSDDGRPGVAYLAHISDPMTGAHAEVRYASAQSANPTQPGDWQIWTVDTAPLPAIDPQNPEVYPLPNGLGLFVDSGRLPSHAPVVAYYDRANGDLKVAKFNPSTGQFGAARVLDGSGSIDAGWTPSVAVDAQGTVHVAYVGSTKDDLKYVTDIATPAPEIVDDGYRIVGQTVDGLPKPEFHFVGDDASLILANGMFPMIAYQDATTQELLLASKGQNGQWTRVTIAGATDPWPGAYGFFAASDQRPGEMVISTWVINQPSNDPFDNNWVEVFARPTGIQ
jgi:MYXO-CTERM domain-containing protein